MGDDMAKIKVGQQPSSMDVQKVVSSGQSVAVVQPKPAPIPVPLAPKSPQSDLGQTQKSAPLPPSPGQKPSAPITPITIPGMPSSVPSGPSIVIPSDNPPLARPRTILYVLILALIITGGVVYWLFGRNSGNVAEQSPTPSPSIQVTPTPSPELFDIAFPGDPVLIELASSASPIADFNSKRKAVILSPGEYKKLAIEPETKGGVKLSPLELLDRFLISYPVGLKSALTPAESLIYGQREAFNQQGLIDLTAPTQQRLSFVIKVADRTVAASTMRGWETTMASVLGDVFEFQEAKAASSTFSDNTYRGVAVRFVNFSFADHTIDYAVITGRDQQAYLIIASSREALYGIIDKLQ